MSTNSISNTQCKSETSVVSSNNISQVQIHPLLIPQLFALQQENARLIQEKTELTNRIIELGLPNDVIINVRKQEKIISDLQEENRQLRQENEALKMTLSALEAKLKELESTVKVQRSEIKVQKSEIDLLKKSYKRESHIAIRSLIDSAKKMTTYPFSPTAQQLIKDKSMKNLVNTSAHKVEASRIYEALAEVPKKFDAAIKEIFSAVYPDYVEDDELFTETDEM